MVETSFLVQAVSICSDLQKVQLIYVYPAKRYFPLRVGTWERYFAPATTNEPGATKAKSETKPYRRLFAFLKPQPAPPPPSPVPFLLISHRQASSPSRLPLVRLHLIACGSGDPVCLISFSLAPAHKGKIYGVRKGAFRFRCLLLLFLCISALGF